MLYQSSEVYRTSCCVYYYACTSQCRLEARHPPVSASEMSAVVGVCADERERSRIARLQLLDPSRGARPRGDAHSLRRRQQPCLGGPPRRAFKTNSARRGHRSARFTVTADRNMSSRYIVSRGSDGDREVISIRGTCFFLWYGARRFDRMEFF